MRLILVRHGETDHNKTGTTLGRADVPLNARGQQQAAALASAIPAPIAAVYTSPLARAANTAAAIAATHGMAPRTADALIEMDVGEMEHLAHQDLRSRYPDFLRAWISAPAHARMPGGETLTEVQDRAIAWLDGVRQQHSAETIVAVSHNFVILTLACHAIGLRLDDFRRLKTSVGGISTVDFSDRGATLLHWNDVTHLPAVTRD